VELKGYSKRAVVVLLGFALLSMSAVAQEIRSEVSVEGTGFFTKDSSGNGIRDRGTNTGGFLVGYRYNINRWVGAEGDYGYGRSTQVYSGLIPARVQANVHQITGSAVVKLPAFGRVLPFVRGGGGALVFDPTNNAGGTLVGSTEEARGTFLYGGGADYVITKRLLLRAEYRGLVYKAPNFNVTSLNTDAWTHVAQPAAGLVFRF
jgi:outer membrane immunogenic protein